MHVWKSVVVNTPKTLRQILPCLMDISVAAIAGSGEDTRVAASRCLGELVRKMTNQVRRRCGTLASVLFLYTRIGSATGSSSECGCMLQFHTRLCLLLLFSPFTFFLGVNKATVQPGARPPACSECTCIAKFPQWHVPLLWPPGSDHSPVSELGCDQCSTILRDCPIRQTKYSPHISRIILSKGT